MKLVIATVLFVACVASALADCDLSGKQLKTGEKYAPLGQCLEYTCHEDGNTSALTCALSFAGAHCKHVPQDNSKPYPSCCERYDC